METLELELTAPAAADLYDEDDDELYPVNTNPPDTGTIPACDVACRDCAGYCYNDGFNNETERINAIPGMAERLLRSRNTPMSEFEDAPESSFRA
ncbi:hypothetical protein R80B4_02505 [Fibrobacteres bacterium R8-0-B4]